MGLKEEFNRFRLIWTVCFLAGGMLLLVNQIEASYARSLIMCDTPISTEPGALFSGSANCGDRNFVINEGQMLSATAQSCENFAKISVMIIAAIFSDLYGRKFMLMLGLTATALSVLCFLVGAVVPSLARLTFYIGQGLQGACPMELIGAQICIDLASRDDTDSQSVMAVGGMGTAVSSAFFAAVVFYIQGKQLTDYSMIWLCTLAVNGLALTATAMFFPETRVKQSQSADERGLVEQVKGEFSDYCNLFSIEGLNAVMLTYIFKSAADSFITLNQAYPMAYYQMSLDTVMLYFMPMIFLAIVCGGVVPQMSAAKGEHKAFWFCNIYLFGGNLWFLLSGYSKVFYFGTYYWFMVLNPGYEGLTTSMCSKMLGEKMAKYTALRALSSYSLAILCGPLYAYIFDAKAVTYFHMLKPVFLALGLRAVEAVFWFHPTMGSFRYMNKTLDLLTEEREKVQAADQSTTAADKKTD